MDLFLSVWGATKQGDQTVLTVPEIINFSNNPIGNSWWGEVYAYGNKVTIRNAPANDDPNQHVLVSRLVYFSTPKN